MADAAKPTHGRDLTQGPIARTLLAFALPTLVSSILQSLNGSINSIWIGRFLGETALASTFNANFIMFLLMAFVFGFGMASTVLIGQAFGARDIDQARRVVGTAIGSFLPVAVLIGVIGWLASPALLHLLAMPPDAMPLRARIPARDLHRDARDPDPGHADDGAARRGGRADAFVFHDPRGDPRCRPEPGVHPRPRPGAEARHRRQRAGDGDRQLRRA